MSQPCRLRRAFHGSNSPFDSSRGSHGHLWLLSSATWQPHRPVHDEDNLIRVEPRFTGALLPAQLKPPSQLELRLAACADEEKATVRATQMPWLTGVAEKVRSEKAAEAQRQQLRQGDLNRKIRGVAATGGMLGAAFSTARQTKEEAERAAREEKARLERERVKLRKRRENARLRKS